MLPPKVKRRNSTLYEARTNLVHLCKASLEIYTKCTSSCIPYCLLKRNSMSCLLLFALSLGPGCLASTMWIKSLTPVNIRSSTALVIPKGLPFSGAFDPNHPPNHRFSQQIACACQLLCPEWRGKCFAWQSPPRQGKLPFCKKNAKSRH